MRIFTYSISVLAILFYTLVPAKAETITIVADEWCPYNCAPDTEKLGIFIEIAKKAFEPKGITIDYKIIPWARAVEETRSGKFTAITGASRGDAPDFIFPKTPQTYSVMSFFVPTESTWAYENEESLKNISVGVINGYSYGTEFDTYVKKNLANPKYIQEVSGDDSLEINTNKLLKKRIGALIESGTVMKYYLAENDLSEKIKEAGSLPVDGDQALYIAFSPKNKNAAKYAEILSNTTKAMNESGEMKTLFEKYNITHISDVPAK